MFLIFELILKLFVAALMSEDPRSGLKFYLQPCFQIYHKSTQRQVDIKIRKQEERWWDRLTLQEKKPLFLAPDFDRWLDESDAETELQAKARS